MISTSVVAQPLAELGMPPSVAEFLHPLSEKTFDTYPSL